MGFSFQKGRGLKKDVLNYKDACVEQKLLHTRRALKVSWYFQYKPSLVSMSE